jgi:hypothetical protein
LCKALREQLKPHRWPTFLRLSDELGKLPQLHNQLRCGKLLIYCASQLPYGDGHIGFQLKRRDRKTLSISVCPDLGVEVVAPADASPKFHPASDSHRGQNAR